MATKWLFRHYWRVLRDALCMLYFQNKQHHGRLNALFGASLVVPAVLLVVTSLFVYVYSKHLINKVRGENQES